MPALTVCFLIANFDGGGAQKQCVQLLNELQQRTNIRLVLVYLHRGEHWHLLRHDHLEVHQISVSSNFDPRIPFRIARIVRDAEVDILLSWMHTSDTYSFLVRRLRLGRVVWVMTERDSQYPSGMRFRLRNRVGRYADAIVSNSAAGDQYWRRRRARGSRYVVDNIVDRTPVRREKSLTGAVLHVGRLEPQKNPLAVARAFCELGKRRGNLRFAFVGEGSEDTAIRQEIASSGMAKQIVLLGFRPDAVTLIASACAVVSLSSHEGLPNVLLEAAAVGTPIVASEIPEHKELLGDSYPYYVRDCQDPTLVADVIDTVLNDPNASLALSGAQRRIARMTAPAVADRYLSVFAEVSDRRPRCGANLR